MEIYSHWKKLHTDSRCTEKYPNEIEFKESGLFFSSGGENSIWDIGEFELLSSKEITLSTIIDKVIKYEYSIDANKLLIVDDADCHVVYIRSDEEE